MIALPGMEQVGRPPQDPAPLAEAGAELSPEHEQRLAGFQRDRARREQSA